MKPGTKPQAASLKSFAGVRPCRIPSEPEITPAPADLMPAPEYLEDIGKRQWNKIYPVLQACGVLKLSDLDTLAGYCYAYSQFIIASQELKKFPPQIIKVKQEDGTIRRQEMRHVFTTPNGAVQALPYVSMARQWLEVMHRLAAELGMTPSARGRVGGAGNGGKFAEDLKFLTHGKMD